ncbi:MAG: 4Fe-4S ferredoxin [Desulfobacteraceae bacterium]|nr:4Fe-4S ferredoxin [Desulfobacteraceae bacterium]
MDVYKKLAQHLDNLPAGFPPTEDGVEIRILKHLFTEKEAELAVNLTMMPETVPAIVERTKISEDGLEQTLLDMSKKGLIFRSTRDGITYFSASQFVIGIWEYQVNRLHKDLIEDFNKYSATLMKKSWEEVPTKQLRVVPVAESINTDMNIMAYEQAADIIKSQSKIVVTDCICRKEHKMTGKGCDHPMEACLAFSSGAYYYEENKLGREISQEEALDILEKGMNAGLVIQPSNSQKPINICMCCGCCCQILKNLKTTENPGQLVSSNFYAAINEDECTACGLCEERCHMEAITIEDIAIIDKKRCIGCGLCVPACEFDAIELLDKPDVEKNLPPKNTMETYIQMATDRGKI